MATLPPGLVRARDLVPKYSFAADVVRAMERRWPDCHVVWNGALLDQWHGLRARWQVWRKSFDTGAWYCALTIEDSEREYRPLDRRVLWDLIDRDLWLRYGRGPRAAKRAVTDIADREAAVKAKQEADAGERLYDRTLDNAHEIADALETQARMQGFSP